MILFIQIVNVLPVVLPTGRRCEYYATYVAQKGGVGRYLQPLVECDITRPAPSQLTM